MPEIFTARELDALSGAALWGYAPAGDDGGADLGDDGEMGKNAISIVVLLACACTPKGPATQEPFQAAIRDAEPEAMRLAFQALIDVGLDPYIDPGSGAAYGDTAPIVTEWRNEGTKHIRWAVYFSNDKIAVDSICKEMAPVVVEKSDGKTDYYAYAGEKVFTMQRCREQPIGLSRTAAKVADIAVQSERPKGKRKRKAVVPDEATVLDEEEPPPVPVCFEVAGEPAHCFDTNEECEREREDRDGPNTGDCERAR